MWRPRGKTTQEAGGALRATRSTVTIILSPAACCPFYIVSRQYLHDFEACILNVVLSWHLM